MADDKTTKTPEQPVTDSGPGKETPPAPPKEPEKVSVSPEPEKKTEPEVKNPQVSVYNFAEIMKEKKVEERAAAPSGEKPAPAKTEKPEKQPEAPKKAEEKPKEPEQPKRRGRPPKADKDKAATPKPEAPAQKPENAVKKEPEKKTAPTVQAAPASKEPEKPKDAPRRGKEQMASSWRSDPRPFESYQLTNNNAEIRRVKARIEQLSKQAQQEFSGWEFDGGRVEMNREDNRLQVFFDGKPDADTRAELKSSGFRWAPSVGAWQRQLTDNAIRAADRLECIKPLSGEKPSQLQKKPSILQTMREQDEKVQTEPEKKAPSGRDAER